MTVPKLTWTWHPEVCRYFADASWGRVEAYETFRVGPRFVWEARSQDRHAYGQEPTLAEAQAAAERWLAPYVSPCC